MGHIVKFYFRTEGIKRKNQHPFKSGIWSLVYYIQTCNVDIALAALDFEFALDETPCKLDFCYLYALTKS